MKKELVHFMQNLQEATGVSENDFFYKQVNTRNILLFHLLLTRSHKHLKHYKPYRPSQVKKENIRKAVFTFFRQVDENFDLLARM